MKKNNKKINTIRRQRGYSFESGIVKKFQTVACWDAVRLGSPSTKLPDVMAVNNMWNKITAIEAKSTVQKYAYVPQDQIERCIDWVNLFGAYKTKFVLIAIKFGQSPGRKLRYFYRVFPHNEVDASEVRIDYDGNIWMRIMGTWVKQEWEDFVF